MDPGDTLSQKTIMQLAASLDLDAASCDLFAAKLDAEGNPHAYPEHAEKLRDAASRLRAQEAEIERLRAVVASHHTLARSSVGPAAVVREQTIEECATVADAVAADYRKLVADELDAGGGNMGVIHSAEKRACQAVARRIRDMVGRSQ